MSGTAREKAGSRGAAKAASSREHDTSPNPSAVPAPLEPSDATIPTEHSEHAKAHDAKAHEAKAREVNPRQQEDRALVQRAREGNQAAYFELVKRHRHGVERLIRPMVRNASTDELEDLVQESLTKALLHLNSYSDEYAFSTWLYRIATNHAIDYLRRRKLNSFSISSPPASASYKSDDDVREFEIRDQSWVPDEVMLADERARLIEDAIEQLPENYKRIIRLRHNDDMEYEEIARVLQLPMGTVKVHLHRARAALAKVLDGKI